MPAYDLVIGQEFVGAWVDHRVGECGGDGESSVPPSDLGRLVALFGGQRHRGNVRSWQICAERAQHPALAAPKPRVVGFDLGGLIRAHRTVVSRPGRELMPLPRCGLNPRGVGVTYQPSERSWQSSAGCVDGDHVDLR
jgi:hypothetical protein